jgi:Uma2 family endonuclease
MIVAMQDRLPDPIDERVVMRLDWDGFEALLELRGERARPKVAYLDGVLELMSPSFNHERIKSNIGRVVEAYMMHANVTFTTCGEWTIRRRKQRAGVEPDECYAFGPAGPVDRPDLAIEVVWTSGGIDKLEIYRRLGIPEVWFWIDGAITVYVLGDTGYETRPGSVCVPTVDLGVVCELLDIEVTSDIYKQLRARLG